jgi:flagella synthesis protein FlgN
MTRGQALEQLATVIDRQVEATTTLLDALTAEQAALAGRDVEQLARATQRKTLALEQLESAERERRRLCISCGIGPSPGDMHALVTGSTEPLATRWRTLTGLLARCRDVNHANGVTVAALQLRVQQALNLLRSGTAAAATYGPTGATTLSSPAARAIARA